MLHCTGKYTTKSKRYLFSIKFAFFRAFGTVLRALSDDFAATPNLVPPDYVDNWLQKILHTTSIIRRDKFYGVLARHANTIVCILLEMFTQFHEKLQSEIFDFIIQQNTLQKQDWPYEADGNLLRLIMKIIDLVDHNSCADLAHSIFASQSRLWLYRFLYSNSVKLISCVLNERNLSSCLFVFSLFKMFYICLIAC